MKAMRLATMLAVTVALAACAGEGSRAPGAQTPPGESTRPNTSASRAAPVVPAPTSVTDSGPAMSSSAAVALPVATAPAVTGPAEAVDMKSPVPSRLFAELAALGLAANNLPPIDSLDPKALRGVMKLIARSLGAKCADCHVEGDFAAPTPRKRIAAHMWNEFAAKLEIDGGGPLFCDSCHQGRASLLDRRDKKALATWMQQNFVAMLARKDAKEHNCETCHVGMEMDLLSKWGAL
jgi:hypothetical protein